MATRAIDATIDVSVLIPVLNEARHLTDCVNAMLAQDVDGELELIFIDGRSDDESVEILERMAARDPRIRVLDNPHRTTARALNIGLRAARGQYVARMDAHAIYPARYLAIGIELLNKTDASWIAGPQIPVGRGAWSEIVAHVLSTGLGRGASDKWHAADDGSPLAAETFELTTSVFTGVWRRETLDRFGGWDPEWPVNQDSELAARMRTAGYRILCHPGMGAEYFPRNTLRALARQYARFGHFRAKTFARHPDSCGPVRLASAGLPVVFLATVPRTRMRLPAGVGTLIYAGLIAKQAAAHTGEPRDRLRVAVALLAMHLTWTSGFLAGLFRFVPQRRKLQRSEPAPVERTWRTS